MAKSKTLLRITKAGAAVSQLEGALCLWFTKNEAVAVHTLAVAAQDCYEALGAHSGKPSVTTEFVQSKSKNFQNQFREAQNFFKHGPRDLKGGVFFDSQVTDMLLIDCAYCHQQMQLRITPLIQLFWFRVLIEYPELRPILNLPTFEADMRRYALNRMSRQEFFNEVLPFIERSLAKQRHGP